MPINKHALIRYKALDRCFSNPGRRYFTEDLLDACNDALTEFDQDSPGIKVRQLFDDIRFMESEAGYSIPLERHREGRKVWYHYSDPDFTISNEPMNEAEANQLREALIMLSRFKGMPQFAWVDEIIARLEANFDLREGAKGIIGFEENPYLKGLEHITPLFNSIVYKKVLTVNYKAFNDNPAFDVTFHPYYLKEYNNRWFVFGWNEGKNCLSNFALDRIQSLAENGNPYIENEEIDFNEYFEDVVGVTVWSKNRPIWLILRIEKSLWPYIETKPIHGSQKVKERGENHITLQYEINPNYELESLLLSYGEKLEVVSPKWFREKFAERIAKMNKSYLADTEP